MKRAGGNIGSLLAKKQKEDERAKSAPKPMNNDVHRSPYLAHPVMPVDALTSFLLQVPAIARRAMPGGNTSSREALVEVEARIGVLKAPFGAKDQRVLSSGPKQVKGRTAPGFRCTDVAPRAHFESGITRSHFVHWTGAALSEISPLSHALGSSKDDSHVKKDLNETEYIETVYAGYPQDRRVCYRGLHPAKQPMNGRMETKERLEVMDLAIPAGSYDIRIQVATEKGVQDVSNDPPMGWTSKRVKRRRCYTRRDKTIMWQIDVTEVTTTYKNDNKSPEVIYELEMELLSGTTLKFINEQNPDRLKNMAKSLARQLWWILENINPLQDVMDVETFLREHTNRTEIKKALAMCSTMKRFMDSGQTEWDSPILSEDPVLPKRLKFTGCMPINFSRHNIDEVQRSPSNGYFLSEKTDGVRHFLVFTGKTAVLVDRAMKGKQPIPRVEGDPFGFLCKLIKPGTVMDGEVVMHRKLKRPIFIVFDIMAIPDPVLHLPFQQRLQHLERSSCRVPNAGSDIFDPRLVHDQKIALPLIRKNFVKRQDLDELLSKVHEEKGIRFYRHGDSHNHMTDGIIFQPNLPYVCGTDVNLLKWKYLDTVTIDVEILPPLPYAHHNNNGEEQLRLGCLGEDDTRVDMTRHIKLPSSERYRLEADRQEQQCKIVEVGFDPTTGEWYYLTTRPDKVAPNHITTVLGTLLELAESLTTEELRYRMSVPPGTRDTYKKDIRRMQKQLLDHQRERNRHMRQQGK